MNTVLVWTLLISTCSRTLPFLPLAKLKLIDCQAFGNRLAWDKNDLKPFGYRSKSFVGVFFSTREPFNSTHIRLDEFVSFSLIRMDNQINITTRNINETVVRIRIRTELLQLNKRWNVIDSGIISSLHG